MDGFLKRIINSTLHWLVISLVLMCLPLSANAGLITIDEDALDLIFSQSNFGNNTIDVRINAFQSITNDDYLNINTVTESQSGLLGLTENALSSDLSTSQSIAMFFVDDISYCGGATSNAVGCGARYFQTLNSVFDNNNASFAFVDSQYVSDPIGSAVIAHEVSHLFGLGHVGTSSARDNLLNPTIDPSNSDTTLTTAQISTIFDRSVNTLIQGDAASGYFIEISPIAIVSSASLVPEPSTYAMLGLGLLLVGFQSQRRKS